MGILGKFPLPGEIETIMIDYKSHELTLGAKSCGSFVDFSYFPGLLQPTPVPLINTECVTLEGFGASEGAT